jgi:3D (Asp-Asp-Asp) domain-containing protein
MVIETKNHSLFDLFCVCLILIGIVVLGFMLIKIMDRHDQLEKKINEISEKEVRALPVTVTAYSREMFPGKNAICEQPIAGWSAAVSRDLKYLLGQRIYLEGMGLFSVDDLMNERFTNSVDLFMGTTKEALEFGTKNSTLVVIGRELPKYASPPAWVGKP